MLRYRNPKSFRNKASVGQNFGTKPSPAIFFRLGELQPAATIFSREDEARTKLKEGGQGAKGEEEHPIR
jgi:hypothetical protein